MIGNEIVSGQPETAHVCVDSIERFFDVISVSRIATPCTSSTIVPSHPFLVMTEPFLGNHDFESS
jgi:hypothetical protein